MCILSWYKWIIDTLPISANIYERLKKKNYHDLTKWRTCVSPPWTSQVHRLVEALIIDIFTIGLKIIVTYARKFWYIQKNWLKRHRNNYLREKKLACFYSGLTAAKYSRWCHTLSLQLGCHGDVHLAFESSILIGRNETRAMSKRIIKRCVRLYQLRAEICRVEVR